MKISDENESYKNTETKARKKQKKYHKESF